MKRTDDKQNIYIIALYVCFFVVLAILNIIIKHYYIDIISDLSLMIVTIWGATYGNLTGLLFFIFVLFRVKNKNHLYIIFPVFTATILLSGNDNNYSIMQIALLLSGYSFFILKYIFTIHIPIQKLIKENEKLKNRLQIIGDAKHMTDDDILYWYPVMKHHDEEKKYLKINMLRDLSTGSTRKVLADKYECSTKTVDRYLDDMKEDFSDRLGLKDDERIYEKQHLTTIGAMLDIIQVIVRQKEY